MHVSTQPLFIYCSVVQADDIVAVTPEEARQYTAIVDDILAQSDLNTISAKAIRKGIQQKVEHDISAKKVGRIARN